MVQHKYLSLLLVLCSIIIYSNTLLKYLDTDYNRPTMRDLHRHVVPLAATNWYKLGILLLDLESQYELDIIAKETRNDLTRSCSRMFSKWLNIDELADWDKLIKALRMAQMNNVANYIEQLLLQGEI